MFTGIVTDVGEVIRCAGGQSAIRARFAPSEIAIGSSIACDGCCLTVTAIEAFGAGVEFCVGVSNETLSKTTLGSWGPQVRVNLERTLRAGDEIGGHFVTGHVDGVATIRAIRPDGDSRRIEIDLAAALARYVAPKGSVALDGVSLTINEVAQGGFGVNIIPHTLTSTTWGRKKPGDKVNVEVDLFARYLARLMECDT